MIVSVPSAVFRQSHFRKPSAHVYSVQDAAHLYGSSLDDPGFRAGHGVRLHGCSRNEWYYLNLFRLVPIWSPEEWRHYGAAKGSAGRPCHRNREPYKKQQYRCCDGKWRECKGFIELWVFALIKNVAPKWEKFGGETCFKDKILSECSSRSTKNEWIICSKNIAAMFVAFLFVWKKWI